MTRQEAKEKLLSDCKIIMHYSWSEDRQKQDIPHSYLSDIKTIKHIDKIYDYFENRSCENCKHCTYDDDKENCFIIDACIKNETNFEFTKAYDERIYKAIEEIETLQQELKQGQENYSMVWNMYLQLRRENQILKKSDTYNYKKKEN